MNLRAFIGSSSELLNVANAVKHALKGYIECNVWTEGFFKLSRTTIEALTSGVDEYDVGIFIFGGDDKLSSRGEEFSTTRDNVIFEHGLFCGRLGLRRTFVLRPKTKTLKWLSDLEGFTPAQYDEELAKSNADRSVEAACAQILDELRDLPPRPGMYFNGKKKRLGSDWWIYSGNEVSSTEADEDGIQLHTEDSLGLKFPQFGNLSATGRFCAIRLKLTATRGGPAYFSLRTGNENIFLSLANFHESEGWGIPRNEFMLRLPHMELGRYYSFVVDLEDLVPFMGPTTTINGFLFRPGLKVSHFGVSDELPVWLKSAPVLRATTAPLVKIEQPTPDATVGREEIVEGTFTNPQGSINSANDIQILVLSPNNFWYPQGPITLTGGRWRVKAYFGDKSDSSGSEFQVAAITTGGRPSSEPIKTLPNALGRSIVRVIRRN
jgi:hypothetical protein